MDIFLKWVIPAQEEPQAGPWGGLPEEGIVITGDDSSMCVSVPEDLPVGQDVEVVHGNINDLGPM